MLRAHTVLLLSLALLIPACLDSHEPDTDVADRHPHQVCPPGETWACYSGPGETDGVGACQRGEKTCNSEGTDYGACVGEIVPSAELCNGVDDDCDGTVDEDCLCAAGEASACYDGPADTQGVGTCADGTHVCNADGIGHGACEGETLPVKEICGDGLDNDCNGDIDQGCVCIPYEQWSCYSAPLKSDGIGACHRGVKTCDADGMNEGPCLGEVTPIDEACGNAIDDDCDGETDEGCTPCEPSPEACGDAIDDDCDGQVDEGCVCAPGSTAACYDGPAGTDGVGACTAGAQTCDAAGTGYGACVGAVTPATEVCGNGLDDDCDGQSDEGCVCAPGSSVGCYGGPAGTDGVGVCVGGAQTCNPSGTGFGACVGSIEPSAEVCGNGLDDDCDGVTDDGCVCEPGSAAACYDGPPGTLGVGTCSGGAMTCNATGTAYGPCLGTVTPAADTCGDLLDTDCDGTVDETCVCQPNTQAACYGGPPGTNGVGACHAGAQTCNGAGSGFGTCVGAVTPVGEVCGDGVDNDCDGLTDEGCIGDRAWNDRNQNGIQDPGEGGLTGVTLLLRTASGALVGVAVTNALGTYWFSNIPSGNYYIEVIGPIGFGMSPSDAGADNVDSDFDSESASTPIFSFSNATSNSTIDAGFYSVIIT